MKNNDTYVYERTIEFPNMVARIFRPVLTEKERERRMEIIKKASVSLLIEAERAKK